MGEGCRLFYQGDEALIPYEGHLVRRKITGEVKRAYSIWSNQMRRCRDPKNPKYKNYGSKGITVDYTLREFVGWWLENIEGQSFKNPSCGRIDHSKGYFFGNIEIQELSENSRERKSIP